MIPSGADHVNDVETSWGKKPSQPWFQAEQLGGDHPGTTGSSSRLGLALTRPQLEETDGEGSWGFNLGSAGLCSMFRGAQIL